VRNRRGKKIEPISAEKAAAIKKLWEMGELSWKLKGKQDDIYKHFVNSDRDIEACLISRQFGKSFTLCLIAVEICIQMPNSIVKYACPVQKMVERIIIPRIKEIIADCPEHLKPEWRANSKAWIFPNGSEIQVAGCNSGQYDNLRGGSADLCIVDEGAFVDELETVIYSVLAPTTDTTDGKIWIASTPNPDEPQHEFHELFVFPMEAEGTLLKFTYLDSPLIDDAKKAKILKRYPGGENNSKFRCEYLCEIPKVSENSVVPEFNANKENIILEEIVLPHHFDGYVSADFGFRDLTIVLFGYYDFMNAQLVIIDELVMNGPEMTTDYLAEEIKKKEDIRFHNEEINMPIKPYLRVADNALQIINDLVRLHDLHFMATKKDNKEAQINQVRLWVSSGKIKIHKRCKHLIYHVENAQWDKSRKTFKNLTDSPNGEVRGGHCDALDALIYLVRNVNEGRNPFPDDYDKLKGPNIFNSLHKPKDTRMQVLVKTIMGIKK
jgi:PBSX family phage terminase large subunit